MDNDAKAESEKETAAPDLRFCAVCGIGFRPSRKDQRYHSPLCRYRAWDARHPRVNAETGEAHSPRKRNVENVSGEVERP